MKPPVLIVDDEVSLCGLLEVFFEKKGYAPVSAQNVAGALKRMEGPEPLLAMVDLTLGPESGLTVVKALLEKYPRLPVVVMTAYGTVEKAVEAVKLGAFDFISKPFEMVFLGKVVEKAVATRVLEDENRELKAIIRRQGVDLVGQSQSVCQLRARIDAIASSESTVLITGESGTGKELVAKLIHQKSLRSHKSFVVVNCSALSENLLESELFGHVKGAFTSAHADKEGLFAVAEGGTVFLDEIGEMPMRTQVKLLRVIQEREITPVGGTATFRIDVRLLAATNVILEEAVAKGRFREDLYYRLNVLRIYTPALSERGEDAALLANHFLQRKAHGRKFFSPEALARIQAYSWPGNVRQLENAVERAIAFSTGGTIDTLELDLQTPPYQGPEDQGLGEGPMPSGSDGSALSMGNGLTPTLNDIEKAWIYWVLSQNNWHKPTAARILGLDISTLYRKIEKYGLKAQS
ncbi:MAG: sigma-54 dependent transcriptional regulator [Fibrobacterota bacterium]|nr:sigma-54 dependent transcriptional regulator [Fibrobacterota bacterium]